MDPDKIITEPKAIPNREPTGEFAVRGAMIKCQFGHGFDVINLPLCHGVYSGENPLLNISDMVVGKNINSFGMCIRGNQEFKCKEFIAIKDEWMNPDETKLKIEGKEALLSGAQTACSTKGGIITITHSGQNAHYIKASAAQSEAIKAKANSNSNTALGSDSTIKETAAPIIPALVTQDIMGVSESTISSNESEIINDINKGVNSLNKPKVEPILASKSMVSSRAASLDTATDTNLDTKNSELDQKYREYLSEIPVEDKVQIKTFIENVKKIEVLATEYYEIDLKEGYHSAINIDMYTKKYKIRKLTMDYLRVKGGYAGIQWKIVAEGNNSKFIKYVDKNLDSNDLKYFSPESIESMKTMKYNDYIIDMPHMVATIEVEIGDISPNNWSGWAADLATMMVDINDSGESDYQVAAQNLLGGNSSFGQADIDSDVDGTLIASMMEDDRDILFSEVLSRYYISRNTNSRYKKFVDYYGGKDGLRSQINWSVNRPLIILKGENASSDIAEAAKKTFYEYIIEKAGY